MYLDNFRLKEKPFLLNTDPQFLWLGRKHKEALATLQYGVQENKGLLLLTGEIGSGKTMLISALESRLDIEEVVVARLPDPGLERREFFFLVARSFGIGRRVFSRESFTEAMDRFLSTLDSEGKKALLIIDEAQIMTPSILEEIRLLSNIEYRLKKLINIFLVGQNEFNFILQEPENRSIRQRITTSYNLELLSKSETATYISHRLKVAGAKKPIFTDNAMAEIHLFSNGSPRQINIISDMALVSGFENEQTKIDREIIRACKERVRVPLVPGRPLPDEPLFDAATWQPPETHENKPDPVALLSRTAKRMSWYSTLALMILLPCGYLLYSDRSRAYLSENIPLLNKVLPAPAVPYPSQSSSWAPSPALRFPSDEEQKDPAVVPVGTSVIHESTNMPATPLKDTKKKHSETLSDPDVSSIKQTDTTDSIRKSMKNRPGDKDIPKSSALPTNPKGENKKSPRSLKTATKVENVIPNSGLAKPAAEPVAPQPAVPPKPVDKETVVKQPSTENPSVGLTGTKKPLASKQPDMNTSASESPDPRDVINWLLQEREKSKVQNRH